MNEKGITFSNVANKEINTMFHITNDAIDKAMTAFGTKPVDVSIEVEALRDYAENLREQYKLLHIKRLKKGKCSVESGISFLELLSCCESIINHCVNQHLVHK
jgi:phosphate:Na+ symporter